MTLNPSPARPKRGASHLELVTSSQPTKQHKQSSPRSAKRQKNNNGTYSVAQLAKRSWASLTEMFSPTPNKPTGSRNGPPVDTSSPKRLAFNSNKLQSQHKLQSTHSSTYPHPSRQPSSTIKPRSLITHPFTPPRPNIPPQPSAHRPSTLATTPARSQPGPLSPIQISSTGKVSRLGGGPPSSISSIEFPDADDEDASYAEPDQANTWPANLASAAYQKKTPMGKNKHKHHLGHRDRLDLDALATQASDLSLSTPTSQPRGPRPFATDPSPPPDQAHSKADLEARVANVSGYLTSSTLLSARRLNGVATLMTGRGHDQATIDALFDRFRLEHKTVPARVKHLTYDRIREKQLLAEKELEARLGAKKRRAFPPRLAPNEKATVDAAMANPKFNSSIFGGEVANKDLRRLRAGTWLNDEVITFYSCMINERAKPVREGTKLARDAADLKLLNAYSVSSFWYGKLSNEGWTKPLSRWTKKVPDVFGLDVLIVPINLGNSHWVCGAINFKRKRIEYYDSLGGHNPSVFPRLRDFLEGEHQFKKKAPMDFAGWEDYFDEDVPQQSNGCDCGVFTCQFMESLSRDAGGFDFEQKNMPYLRDKMVLEIAEQRLIVEPWA